jgi:hypothetical protein
VRSCGASLLLGGISNLNVFATMWAGVSTEKANVHLDYLKRATAVRTPEIRKLYSLIIILNSHNRASLYRELSVPANLGDEQQSTDEGPFPPVSVLQSSHAICEHRH